MTRTENTVLKEDITFTTVPGWRGAPIYVPNRLPTNPKKGKIYLPTRLYWSGRRDLDTRNRDDLKKAYNAIMSEGNATDILANIDRDSLLEIFDNMYLAPYVRDAWTPVIERERSYDEQLG